MGLDKDADSLDEGIEVSDIDASSSNNNNEIT